jgi:outer membrane biosynthesis protein TonB
MAAERMPVEPDQLTKIHFWLRWSIAIALLALFGGLFSYALGRFASSMGPNEKERGLWLESRWSGLGGGLGGWRASNALVYLLLLAILGGLMLATANAVPPTPKESSTAGPAKKEPETPKKEPETPKKEPETPKKEPETPKTEKKSEKTDEPKEDRKGDKDRTAGTPGGDGKDAEQKPPRSASRRRPPEPRGGVQCPPATSLDHISLTVSAYSLGN